MAARSIAIEKARLRGGRHVHAVVYPSGHADRYTACGRYAEDGTFLDEDAPVTCPACIRAS
jgi:hypothetical protein